MILLGLFFVYTGNAMPKMLTPLSALQCDPARVQAMQRFAAWTWVLMGFAYSTVWAVVPRNAAKPLATLIVLFGTLSVFARVLRLWRRSVRGPERHVCAAHGIDDLQARA